MNGSRPPAGEPITRFPHYDSLSQSCRLFRDTRMTLVFGALAVLPVRTFRCMAMWKVSWIESGIGIVLKTLGFWTPDHVIFVTPAHSVVR
jgi:hypothetical protein